MKPTNFTSILLDWHEHANKREMPWKGEKDPYKIWLSEIILQQTRVEQGWTYYEKFIKQYPTVTHLAAAKDETVFKLWEGLGYYNRCKNLLFTARLIVDKFQSVFPATYEEIVELKGIGPYTAAAIASFAFNLPYAVLDGNVFRVLSRLFAIDTPTDSSAGKKEFTILASRLLDKQFPALYNQAIMDFGATICKPVAPVCSICPANKLCKAFAAGIMNTLPVKEKVLLKKNRWFYYFIFQYKDKILVHKRILKDIWENLYEFYLVETTEQVQWTEKHLAIFLKEQLDITEFTVKAFSPAQKQQLTHQQIKGLLIQIDLKAIPQSLQNKEWQSAKSIAKLAFPKFINQGLEELDNKRV
jgi:A/G-specific adenine glycosylase